MNGPVYLNGRFVAPEQACLPVTDRGLLFGDSVYEVIPAYAGIPFRAEQHLDRLQRSLDAIGLSNPLSRAQWLELMTQLCRRCTDPDHSIYIQVTRGAYATRAHRLPPEARPNVIAFTAPIAMRDMRIARAGIRAITLEDIRWHRCDIKSTNLLANVMAQANARRNEAEDAIFLRDGFAREGTSSNLFIVLDGLLLTPPNSDEILPGITRGLVLQLAADAGVAHAEASIDEAALRRASEVWLTSSTREIAPVVELDGLPVGEGKPGPHWHRMDQLYQAAKERMRMRARSGERHEPKT